MGASFTIVRCDDELLDLDSLCKGISVLHRGANWSLKNSLLANERAGILAMIRHVITYRTFILFIKLFVDLSVMKVRILAIGLAFAACYKSPHRPVPRHPR
jgi:hypothetical protein